MQKRNYIFIFFTTIVVDVFLINSSFIMGYYLKNGFTQLPSTVIEQNSRLLIFATFTLLALFQFFSLYKFEKIKEEIDEIGSIIGALTLGMFFFEFMTIFYRDLIFKRLIIFWAWIFSVLLIALFRVAIIFIRKKLFKAGIGSVNIIVIGTGEIAKTLVQKILNEPENGMRIVGLLDEDASNARKDYFGVKVLGDLSNIKKIIKEKKVSKIIFAIPDALTEIMMKIIEECELEKVEFQFIPKMLDIVSSRISTDDVAGFPLITVKEIQLYGLNSFLKRSFDLFFGSVILILLLPLFIIVIILIMLDSKGSVLFSQTRIGRLGNIFNMYKFRSMIDSADESIDFLRSLNEADGHIFKIKNDPRITIIGKFLRRLSLDELPQIINVLKGEMSLVGPRPPLPREVEKYNVWHKKRLRITPGITGLWQVSGRSELPFDDMVKLDIYYIENWSLWLDVKILLKTIPAVLFARGAY